MKAHTVTISAYSDADPDPARRVLWGDYWFKERLIRALRRRGLSVNRRKASFWLHLFGNPMDPPPPFSEAPEQCMLWIHSHPALLTQDLLDRYGTIFSASPRFAAKLRSSGVSAECFLVPTHMRPLEVAPELDICFVGNTRRPQIAGSKPRPRPLVAALLEIRTRLPRGLRIGVWGLGWEGLLPRGWFRGERVSPTELNALYSRSRVILNDHHPDMAREGFYNPRILDALAAGTSVVTDPVSGVGDVFPRGVTVVRSPEELREALGRILRDPGASGISRREASTLARLHSFGRAAVRLEETMETLRNPA